MMHASSLRRLVSVSVLLSSLVLTGAVAAGESRIELTDGSVILGDLISVDDGRYRVRSDGLGEIWIPESSIRSLRPRGGPAEPPSQDLGAAVPNHAAEIASIQRRLVSDQGLMQQIRALQQDPAIQSVLADPELSRLILSGDLERLRSDPRFQRLMASPSIQAILSQFRGQ